MASDKMERRGCLIGTAEGCLDLRTLLEDVESVVPLWFRVRVATGSDSTCNAANSRLKDLRATGSGF